MASTSTLGPAGISPEELPALRRRAILACSIGNFFEIFDFTIYGFFAVAISRAFFPAGDPTMALLATFATFGVAFIMRPVGAVIIGRYGDRFGRRAALVVTIALMATATGLTGLVPSYNQIGVLAPVLLLICRLGQGFSTGGEWGGAAAFLVEYAEPGKRGITGAWQQFSTQFGALFGSLLGAFLPWVLATDDFYAWGWRIPFILGFVLGPVGYYLRMRVAETPVFERVVEERSVSHTPLGTTLTEHFDMVIYAFGLSAVGPALQYLFNFFVPSMMQQQFKMDPGSALLAISIALAWLTVLTPCVGWASDRVGRKVFILLSGAGGLIFAWPLFNALASDPSFWNMLLVECIAMTFLSFYTGVIPSILAEMFPTQVRYTALSVSYGFSVMLFGGFAPFVATRLVAATGSPVSPAFFVMLAGFISLLAILKMPDRFNAPLH
jgi:MHS family proline/betaine transporter-like MFS transporter